MTTATSASIRIRGSTPYMRRPAFISTEGWYGIPTATFRSALISACKYAGFATARERISFFVEPDGVDEDDEPLVKIAKGTPIQHFSVRAI